MIVGNVENDDFFDSTFATDLDVIGNEAIRDQPYYLYTILEGSNHLYALTNVCISETRNEACKLGWF